MAFPLPFGVPTSESRLLQAIESELSILASYESRLSIAEESRMPNHPFTFRRVDESQQPLPKVSIRLNTIIPGRAVDYQILNGHERIIIGFPTCVYMYTLPIRKPGDVVCLERSFELQQVASLRIGQGFVILTNRSNVVPYLFAIKRWCEEIKIPTKSRLLSLQSASDQLMIRSLDNEIFFWDSFSLEKKHQFTMPTEVIDSNICQKGLFAVFLVAGFEILVFSLKDYEIERRFTFGSLCTMAVSPVCEFIVLCSNERCITYTPFGTSGPVDLRFPAKDARAVSTLIVARSKLFDRTSLVFYTPRSEPLASLTIHNVNILSMRITKTTEDDSLLLIHGDDGSISIWTFTTAGSLASIPLAPPVPAQAAEKADLIPIELPPREQKKKKQEPMPPKIGRVARTIQPPRHTQFPRGPFVIQALVPMPMAPQQPQQSPNRKSPKRRAPQASPMPPICFVPGMEAPNADGRPHQVYEVRPFLQQQAPGEAPVSIDVVLTADRSQVGPQLFPFTGFALPQGVAFVPPFSAVFPSAIPIISPGMQPIPPPKQEKPNDPPERDDTDTRPAPT
jgi:hypothetical protein